MSMECQVNVKSQSELDIGGRETCSLLVYLDFSNSLIQFANWAISEHTTLKYNSGWDLVLNKLIFRPRQQHL